MKVDISQTVAILSLPAMLGVAGLGTFFWMAGTGWSDMTGVGVGIIYVALTVIQIIFTVHVLENHAGAAWAGSGKVDLIESISSNYALTPACNEQLN